MGGLVGGGFFGSGGSSTEQTDKHSENQQNVSGSGSAATSLSNVSAGKNSTLNIGVTDYGSIGNAFKFGTDALSFGGDAFSFGAEALNTGAGLVSDALNGSLQTANNAMNFASDYIDSVSTANLKTSAMNTEFLGAVTDWSKTASQNMMDMQNNSLAQDRYFLDASAKENSENRILVSDSMGYMNQAWSRATDGLMNLSSDFLNASLTTQNAALAAIDKNSQAAQGATLKAMQGVFDSTKSDVERVASDGIKYIFYGVVALVALPILAGMFKRANT